MAAGIFPTSSLRSTAIVNYIFHVIVARPKHQTIPDTTATGLLISTYIALSIAAIRGKED